MSERTARELYASKKKMTAEKTKTLPLSPIVDGIAIVVGIDPMGSAEWDAADTPLKRSG